MASTKSNINYQYLKVKCKLDDIQNKISNKESRGWQTVAVYPAYHFSHYVVLLKRLKTK